MPPQSAHKRKQAKEKRRPGPAPSWLPLLPGAIEQLEKERAPFVTRGGVERLLRVHRRQAIDLLHRWGAARIGRDLVIRRETLAAIFRSLLKGRPYQEEMERRARLTAELQRARAARLRFAAGERRLAVTGLPDGVTLLPGRIEVVFESPRQGVERLYALAKALLNDFEAFERASSPIRG
jgi:hypothetical protein